MLISMFVCLYGEGRSRLDQAYPLYGAHELPDEVAVTSVVVLTTSSLYTFPCGRDLNPQPSLQGRLAKCKEFDMIQKSWYDIGPGG